MDYVAAKPAVLMGHHFSSIAGAAPINGPIQASVFGWLPVFLWCAIGGIFFGGLKNFGSLFASIRHGGKFVGEIIQVSMGDRAKKLFIIFALLVLILVIASFVNVDAGTFASANSLGFTANPTGNETIAIVSPGFILLIFGLNPGFAIGRTAWIVFIGAYITIASLVPVWILLQPRDYLSSFLLYAMMIVALLGIVISAFAGIARMAVFAKIGMIGAGTAAWGDWFQLLFAAAMVILALVLVLEGIRIFFKTPKKKA